jgi:hypothetical protein
MDIGHADSHVPTARDATISMSRIQKLIFREKMVLRECLSVRREIVN